jgi:hypothetical protein
MVREPLPPKSKPERRALPEDALGRAVLVIDGAFAIAQAAHECAGSFFTHDIGRGLALVLENKLDCLANAPAGFAKELVALHHEFLSRVGFALLGAATRCPWSAQGPWQGMAREAAAKAAKLRRVRFMAYPQRFCLALNTPALAEVRPNSVLLTS